ncbi:MAG: molybdenum-dependent transcriptional regulator [Candidatus Altiarchaeales archaeon HGW-Altiarchaeales-1]|nr:MAG: molybdenum-dependent transcriptional regulator [Candidatus Altiarchaeales archaeon HGW-Altiarchaeales-1]
MEPKIKILLNDGKINEKRIKILKFIEKSGSLNKASKELGITYKHAWDEIKDMENCLNEKLLRTISKGRKGGGTTLTEKAKEILNDYEIYEKGINLEISDKFWESLSIMSARNKINGIIEEIEIEGVAAEIKIKVNEPVEIVALITRTSAERLKLKKGDAVFAIIKATDVMLGK